MRPPVSLILHWFQSDPRWSVWRQGQMVGAGRIEGQDFRVCPAPRIYR